MIFQSLDNKRECYKIYCNGELIDAHNDLCTHTWAPAMHLEDKDVEYAQIWCQGKTLSDACPEEYQNRLKHVEKRAKTFLRTFRNARINLDEVCFYDLVPEKFLLDFCEVKTEITKSVFENHKRPENYDFLRELVFFLKKIETKPVNIDISAIDSTSDETKVGLNKVDVTKRHVIYNPWKTVTGRLTTDKSSFPILTLSKDLRSIIKPQNDLFVELDFNSAELRVLMGLLGQEQPKEDFHVWINENIFDGKLDREKTKKKVFSWLYNPNAKNKKLNKHLNRDELYERFYDGNHVTTPYGRTIPVDKDKAVNYLVQSTSSDMLLTAAMKLDKILAGKRSYISFCIHDSVVVDMSHEDKDTLRHLISEFADTRFGQLRTNLSMGKDFGNMRKIK